MSLRPQTSPTVPEETHRIARAAFPKARSACASPTCSDRSTRTSSSQRCSPAVGDPLRRRAGSRSRWRCSSSRTYPIARWPMLCAGGSAGSMRSAWHSPTLASTIPC